MWGIWEFLTRSFPRSSTHKESHRGFRPVCMIFPSVQGIPWYLVSLTCLSHALFVSRGRLRLESTTDVIQKRKTKGVCTYDGRPAARYRPQEAIDGFNRRPGDRSRAAAGVYETAALHATHHAVMKVGGPRSCRRGGGLCRGEWIVQEAQVRILVAFWASGEGGPQ